MKYLLFLCGMGATYIGLTSEVQADSVMHQLYGALWLIIAAVLVGSASIVDAIHMGLKRLRKDQKTA